MAGWMTTNLEPTGTQSGGFVWRFNLNAIPQMLSSYGQYDCWPLIDRLSSKTTFRFLRAQNSARWAPEVLAEFLQRQSNPGVLLHELPNSGHWVHVDNPLDLARNLQNFL